MRVIVADASPLHYLVLIGEIDLLPRLFAVITVPYLVKAELLHRRAPAEVRDWLSALPSWLRVVETPPVEDLPFGILDDGERAAIALALSLKADLVLMDDRAGVGVALSQGLQATGTLGVLDLAARRGMIDLRDAFERLRATSFRCRPELLDQLLESYEAGRQR